MSVRLAPEMATTRNHPEGFRKTPVLRTTDRSGFTARRSLLVSTSHRHPRALPAAAVIGRTRRLSSRAGLRPRRGYNPGAMGRRRRLARAIEARLTSERGTFAVFGDAKLARELHLAGRRVFSFSPRSHRHRHRADVPLPIITADYTRVPIGAKAFDGLVAAQCLGRSATPREMLEGWGRALKPGGQLLLAQRALPLHRSRLAQELTALLLNSGFLDVSQARSAGCWLTWGRWAALPPSTRDS